jgi:hypothetical protein
LARSPVERQAEATNHAETCVTCKREMVSIDFPAIAPVRVKLMQPTGKAIVIL